MAKKVNPKQGDCFVRDEGSVLIYRRVDYVGHGRIGHTELRVDGVREDDYNINIDDIFSVAVKRAMEPWGQWHKAFVLYPRDDFAAALWSAQDFVRSLD